MSETTQRTLLAVHAHPDDECISTGGVLARYSAEGYRTVLVTCTGGEAGEISHPTLATPENLGAVRSRELDAAVAILGINHSIRLGYRDSGMMGTADNTNPACFWQVDFDAAVERLTRILRTERPSVVVTYDANGGYGHPDHIQAHRITVAAVEAAADQSRYPSTGPAFRSEKFYFTSFPRSQVIRFTEMLREAGIEAPFSAQTGADSGTGTAFGTPDEVVTTAIDVSAFVLQKRAALTAHRTQMGPESWFMRMPPELFQRAWSREHFQRVFGPGSGSLSDPETDLFAGLD